MARALSHPEGTVHIEDLANGRKRVTVECFDSRAYIPLQSCETSYSQELIELTLKVHGLAWLCDAIARDEDPVVAKAELEANLFEFFDEKVFAGKRLLDFGCGSGASTMCLAGLLPQTEIIGVELAGQLIELAHTRARFHGFNNVQFQISPAGKQLPANLGEFDFCMMSAVYEHLLPEERTAILPQIWSLLKPGGVLFINQTPHRYFPIEMHSTGLPLINYLPESLAFFLARRMSRMKPMRNDSREDLLRGGIRGATEFEIMKLLKSVGKHRPILLEPHHGGHRDRIDLWHARLATHRLRTVKLLLKHVLKIMKAVSGHVLIPYLTIAIQKGESD